MRRVCFYGDLTVDVIDGKEQLGGSANCQRQLAHLMGDEPWCKRFFSGSEPAWIPRCIYDTHKEVKTRGEDARYKPSALDYRWGAWILYEQQLWTRQPHILVLHQQNTKEETSFWKNGLAGTTFGTEPPDWICVDTRSYEFIEKYFESDEQNGKRHWLYVKISEEHLPTPNKLAEWSDRATFLVTTPDSCEVIQKGESCLWLRDKTQPSNKDWDVGCGDVFFATWIYEFLMKGQNMDRSVREAMRLATKKTTISFGPCVVSP